MIDAKFTRTLQDQFGRHCEVGESLADGRTEVQVAALSIAEHLAGRGATIEVVEPESVQAELSRIDAELVGRYGP